MDPAKSFKCQSCSEHTQFFQLPLTDRNSERPGPNWALLGHQHPSLVLRCRSSCRPSLHHLGYFGYLKTEGLPRKGVDRYKIAPGGCTLNRDFPHCKPFLYLHSYHRHACACLLADLQEYQFHFRGVSCTISSVVVTRPLIVG